MHAGNLELDAEQVQRQTDSSSEAEGLHIWPRASISPEVEEALVVTERYKFVRSSFLTTVVGSESHWLDRPIVPNLLDHGVDIYAGAS